MKCDILCNLNFARFLSNDIQYASFFLDNARTITIKYSSDKERKDFSYFQKRMYENLILDIELSELKIVDR